MVNDCFYGSARVGSEKVGVGGVQMARNDVIEFLCPNGHRIRCPAEQAGRAAKCPKCGIRFRIPSPTQDGVSDSPGASYPTGDSDVSPPELTDSGISGHRLDAPAADNGPEEPQIEFLCPNGHRLHGSANLQGLPGECPECGARFRIPVYGDDSQGAGAQRGTRIEASAGEGRAARLASSPPSAAHPLAAVFARLWAERPPEAVIALHLRDGETLQPERFAEGLSQQYHGVFATAEPQGTHALTVVAWDAVSRVVVQGVRELPAEFSE